MAVAPSALRGSNNDNSTMNIWAVAILAALGATFFGIDICTSILYRNWCKCKVCTEEVPEEAVAAIT